MKLENHRFANLERFKYKCAEASGIEVVKVTDKYYAQWLGIDPRYYSHWKTGKKLMSHTSARKLEKVLGIDPFSLDDMGDEIQSIAEFQQRCFLQVRKYMITHGLNPSPDDEIQLASQLFHHGKANGLTFDHDLLRQLALAL